MNIWDWIILIINIACLIGSIIGAVQAHSSYKKCKQLTIVPPNKPCQKSRSIFSVVRIEKGTDLVRI